MNWKPSAECCTVDSVLFSFSQKHLPNYVSVKFLDIQRWLKFSYEMQYAAAAWVCLSRFKHFVGLALKRLTRIFLIPWLKTVNLATVESRFAADSQSCQVFTQPPLLVLDFKGSHNPLTILKDYYLQLMSNPHRSLTMPPE